MGLQMACLCACLATLWAAERFFTSVDFFTGLQISVVWIFSWVFRLLACANVLPHFEQLKGLSTVWIFHGLQIACKRECLATLLVAEWFGNSVDFFTGLQISPMRECLATLWAAEWFATSLVFFMGLQICACANVLPHLEQLNGLPPVWIFSWVSRFLPCTNVLPHFEQLKGLSTVWIFYGSSDCLRICLATL